MFSPLADTTFSSFFSGVVSGAGLVGPQLGPTNILSHSPPPPPLPAPPSRCAGAPVSPCRGSLPASSCSGPAPGVGGSDALTEDTPFFSPARVFSLCPLSHWLGLRALARVQCVSGSWADSSEHSGTMIRAHNLFSPGPLLWRPKTPTLQLSPVPGCVRPGRGLPDMLGPLTDARIKTAGCRPLLRFPLNGQWVSVKMLPQWMSVSAPHMIQTPGDPGELHSTVSCRGRALPGHLGCHPQLSTSRHKTPSSLIAGLRLKSALVWRSATSYNGVYSIAFSYYIDLSSEADWKDHIEMFMNLSID